MHGSCASLDAASQQGGSELAQDALTPGVFTPGAGSQSAISMQDGAVADKQTTPGTNTNTQIYVICTLTIIYNIKRVTCHVLDQ